MPSDTTNTSNDIINTTQLALEEMAKSNIDLAWLSIASISVIALFFIVDIVITWLYPKLLLNFKIKKTVEDVLWFVIFILSNCLLFSFAIDGKMTASSSIYIISTVCITFGGILSATSKVRDLIVINWGDDSANVERIGYNNSFSTDEGASLNQNTNITITNDNKIRQKKAQSSIFLSIPFISSIIEILPGQSKFSSKEKNDDNSVELVAFHNSKRNIENVEYHDITIDKKIADKPTTVLNYLSTILTYVMKWVVPILFLGIVSILSFMFLELPSNPAWLSITDPFLSSEITIITCFVTGMWLICQRKTIGYVLPMLICLIYGVSEYFVETFKMCAIMPGDLRSMITGLNVAGGYEYNLTSCIVLCVALIVFIVGILSWTSDPLRSFLSRKTYILPIQEKNTFLFKILQYKQLNENLLYIIKKVGVSILSVVIGVMFIVIPINEALNTNWEEEGIEFNYWLTQETAHKYGLIPAFITALQLEQLPAPEGYSTSKAKDLQSRLAQMYDKFIGEQPERIAAQQQYNTLKPNVVVVMNETFSDLSIINELGVGYKGPEFIQNMDAIAKGKTNVSVYGGGTCNSEFEGLTGTSLGYVSAGINPYSVYNLSGLNSVPKQFKSLGYDTVAIHPENKINWGRDSVYPAIGIDTFIDKDSFDGAEQVRGHVRDSETYKKVLEQLKAAEAPQFIFNLTMQNHGGWDSGLLKDDESYDYDFTGIVDKSAANTTNEYLSSIRLSDIDLQNFISELQNFEEPTVVIFYGDHQPGFSLWFTERFGEFNKTLEYEELKYQTEFFVWSNYNVAGSQWQPKPNNIITETENNSSTPYSNNTNNNNGIVIGSAGTILYDGIRAEDYIGPLPQEILDRVEPLIKGEDTISQPLAPIDNNLVGDINNNSQQEQGINTVDNSVNNANAENKSEEKSIYNFPQDGSAQNDVEPIFSNQDNNTFKQIDTNQYLQSNSSSVSLDDIYNINQQLVQQPENSVRDDPGVTNPSGYPIIQSNNVIYRTSISPASLISWTLNYIGTPMTDYQKADYISRWWILSNNVYGYVDALGRWHAMNTAEEFGEQEDIYNDAIKIIDNVMLTSSLPTLDALNDEIDENGIQKENNGITNEQTKQRFRDDMVMVNVMRWITHLNFAEKIK